MGYACPVCGDPQQDAGHLANHLAFTALLGDAAHETWLDEQAPGWADAGEAELADRVVEHADEREFPQVFEDTTADDDAHGRRSDGEDRPPDDGLGDPPTDDAAREIFDEARDLTARMRSDDGDEDADSSE